MSSLGPAPRSAQIFSLMHQHWQIDPKYAAVQVWDLSSVFQYSLSRDRESARQPVPNQRLREGAPHSTRGQWTASHSFWESLCTCKRTSRCEYIHHFYLSNILFLLIFFITKQYNLSLVIFIAFFQDAAIYVYFKYYRYCPSEIPNVEFFNGIKVPIHSGNQKASSRGWTLFVETFWQKNFEK